MLKAWGSDEKLYMLTSTYHAGPNNDIQSFTPQAVIFVKKICLADQNFPSNRFEGGFESVPLQVMATGEGEGMEKPSVGEDIFICAT